MACALACRFHGTKVIYIEFLYRGMGVGGCINACLAVLSRWQKGYPNLFLSKVCHVFCICRIIMGPQGPRLTNSESWSQRV